MSWTGTIRDLWDDLFYSSLVQRLEQDLMLCRADAQQLRQDKDAVIGDLRSEKALLQAKVGMYELNINRRVGIDPAAKNPKKPSFANFNSPPALSPWQREVMEHDAQNAKELEEEALASKGATNV
jgi:hypothetical protein